MKRGLIQKPLPENEITALIDYHAATGIDPHSYPHDLFRLDSIEVHDYL